MLCKHGDPSSIANTQNPSMVTHACYPSATKVETGRSLVHTILIDSNWSIDEL